MNNAQSTHKTFTIPSFDLVCKLLLKKPCAIFTYQKKNINNQLEN